MTGIKLVAMGPVAHEESFVTELPQDDDITPPWLTTLG